MSTSPSDPADLRRNYERCALRRADLDPDPFAQFRRWFTDAIESPGVVEANAMTLSTVDRDGQPSSRAVLLKAYDRRGFVFFTNYQSRKAREIAANPKASLLFPWLGLERQLEIQGVTEIVTRTETLKYFLSRPRGNQLGAWVSHQSSVISSKSLLLAKVDEMKRKFAKGEIPCPEFWGGYRVVPHRFEFWQGGKDRIHDRFEYRLAETGEWKIERLAP